LISYSSTLSIILLDWTYCHRNFHAFTRIWCYDKKSCWKRREIILIPELRLNQAQKAFELAQKYENLTRLLESILTMPTRSQKAGTRNWQTSQDAKSCRDRREMVWTTITTNPTGLPIQKCSGRSLPDKSKSQSRIKLPCKFMEDTPQKTFLKLFRNIKTNSGIFPDVHCFAGNIDYLWKSFGNGFCVGFDGKHYL